MRLIFGQNNAHTRSHRRLSAHLPQIQKCADENSLSGIDLRSVHPPPCALLKNVQYTQMEGVEWTESETNKSSSLKNLSSGQYEKEGP